MLARCPYGKQFEGNDWVLLVHMPFSFMLKLCPPGMGREDPRFQWNVLQHPAQTHLFQLLGEHTSISRYQCEMDEDMKHTTSIISDLLYMEENCFHALMYLMVIQNV
jgi:hypothetical protein